MFRRLRAAYSIASDPIWQKFELMQGIMHVFVISNFKIDQIDSSRKLEFMLMKHYAPNRCEPSIEALNFGGGGGQGRCERRSEVFVIFFFFGGGGSGSRWGWMRGGGETG